MLSVLFIIPLIGLPRISALNILNKQQLNYFIEILAVAKIIALAIITTLAKIIALFISYVILNDSLKNTWNNVLYSNSRDDEYDGDDEVEFEEPKEKQREIDNSKDNDSNSNDYKDNDPKDDNSKDNKSSENKSNFILNWLGHLNKQENFNKSSDADDNSKKKYFSTDSDFTDNKSKTEPLSSDLNTPIASDHDSNLHVDKETINYLSLVKKSERHDDPSYINHIPSLDRNRTPELEVAKMMEEDKGILSEDSNIVELDLSKNLEKDLIKINMGKSLDKSEKNIEAHKEYWENQISSERQLGMGDLKKQLGDNNCYKNMSEFLLEMGIESLDRNNQAKSALDKLKTLNNNEELSDSSKISSDKESEENFNLSKARLESLRSKTGIADETNSEISDSKSEADPKYITATLDSNLYTNNKESDSSESDSSSLYNNISDESLAENNKKRKRDEDSEDSEEDNKKLKQDDNNTSNNNNGKEFKQNTLGLEDEVPTEPYSHMDDVD